MAMQGGCACGAIRYKLAEPPLIVHACHCRDCQRITGSAFVINLWIERKFVEAAGQPPKSFKLAGGSGQAHEVFFCGDCGTYVWSVTTAHLATRCLSAPGRSTVPRRSSLTFISSHGAKYPGWTSPLTCQLTSRSTRSMKSGEPQAESGCVATARKSADRYAGTPAISTNRVAPRCRPRC